MPSISIAKLFAFKRMKVNFSVCHSFTDQEFAGVSLVPDKRSTPRCSTCGRKTKQIHAERNRSVRDLPLGVMQTAWINFHYRLVKCHYCGSIHVEESDVADVGGPRVTKRFARYIQALCKLMPVSKVAKHLKLDWKTVKNIDKQGLIEGLGETDYKGLKLLAIDEVSYARYHKYLTVVIDYETGRVVWSGEGRKRETLEQFFVNMPVHIKDSIEAVAMDMWEPYTQVVKEQCPNATIVYDFFHIVATYSKVIDRVRRQEYHKAVEQDKRVIKGSRWMLLKNPANLKDTEKPKLAELLATNEPLAKAYILKDELKVLWTYTERPSMAAALDEWCAKALDAKLPPLTEFVDLLQRHRDGILNHATGSML